MKIKLQKLHRNAVTPSYQTVGSAGFDIAACIDDTVVIPPHGRAIIPSGFAVALPVGYELQIRGRSSMAVKCGIMPANGVGTIDSDYRGEIGVILLNTSTEPCAIEPGMRIAQGVITRHQVAQWSIVEELDTTDRGTGGFGSTGSHG